MRNKKLVMQGVLVTVGVLSIICPIGNTDYNAKEVKAERYAIEKDITANVVKQEHSNVRLPQLIIVEPETKVTSETETEIITEAVVEVKPYNYYRVNDNGCYAQLDLKLQDYLWSMCEKYDICDYYEVIMAQMFTESSFRTNLVSKTNDYGLMQINVCNHGWLSEKLGSSNFNDPYISIEAGCLMMSNYLHKYDIAPALVAYNRGESAVRNKGIMSTEYSDKVLANMKKLEVLEEN